jgi:hypothetical protein
MGLQNKVEGEITLHSRKTDQELPLIALTAVQDVPHILLAVVAVNLKKDPRRCASK